MVLGELDLRKVFAIALGVICALVIGAIVVIWSGGPPFAPTEVLVENNRAESIVVELADGRAWEVPPDGWGPAERVPFGTRATIYTAMCERIADVTFKRGSGFIVSVDEPPREVAFGDINVTTTPHLGCT
jgi:hypothetical protein